MTLSIQRLPGTFAAEVFGVDVREPLSSDETARIEAGLDRHAVLVFRDQRISDEQQIAFTLSFGIIENAAGGDITKPYQRRLDIRLNDLSNLDQNHRPLAREDRRRMFNLGNRLWHSDSSYRAIPAKYSLLSARELPDSGGNTEFADMRAAYDALDYEARAEVDGLICEHSLLYSRGALGFDMVAGPEDELFKPVRQALVRTHPVTGRRSLFLSAHAGAILGWPLPEGRVLLRDLTELATQSRFVYVHRWRPHDLLMWDNRQTMHRVRRFDESQIRDMRRTTVAGDQPTALQADEALRSDPRSVIDARFEVQLVKG